ncbi:metal ABC transporter ATP-binding protein [Siminovitchia fortis]|uniref:Metal ABC transporter ATP-binding protein n=1 Tax=Siminovitchia fortis TaxID=254758 RepID=A0A443J488_9BACI|nr:metal ABC transporter ATP-binding protein [Siminovitchia fortis]RWR15133.1 metal ABC transporter ATP-binding protein [Siminovitchia fortis]WHY82729.1 metal ABC transporter ATP-binding protein [Siminovitchia fortis]
MISEKVIEIKNISFQYDREIVLNQIHLTVPKGSFLGIVGPNGSGKSTLLKLILGLLRPDEGEILLFGEKQSKFRQWERIGFVSQKANSFNTGFPATVFEVVASGLTGKLGLFRFLRPKHKREIIQAIEQVGMKEFMYRKIGELSGGQQQRVFIARAIVSRPEILILDEPTVGVDAKNVQSFYKILKSLKEQRGITLLMVSHDIDALLSEADHVVYLNKRVQFYGDTDEYKSIRGERFSLVDQHGS